MALRNANRVKETTSTTGTGTLDLAGTETGFQTFVAGIGTTNECYYFVTDNTDWETGIGTVTGGTPDTLSRDTVFASTNAGAKVNWGSGNKDIFCMLPAEAVGSGVQDVVAITTNTTADAGANGTLYEVNTSSGAVTLTLPAIADVQIGHTILAKVTDATNTFTWDGNAVETIDGDTTHVIKTAGQVEGVYSNGTEWKVLASSVPGPAINAQTGTSYTIVTDDRGKLLTLNNASAVAVTLPQAGTAGFKNSYRLHVKNIGAGTVTITPTTSTIDGGATLVLATNESAIIFSDGTNYFTTGIGLAVASQAEMEAGTSNTVIVTPGVQEFHQSACKGWVRFNGTGTVAIDASYNVTSITDNGTGSYTINWATNFSSANHSFTALADDIGGVTAIVHIQITDPTAGAAGINTRKNIDNAVGDCTIVCVMAFGDQ